MLLAAFLAVFTLLALAGGLMDLRKQIITNRLNAAILIIGLVAVPIVFGWSVLLWCLVHFAIALVVGIALFALGMWGGGDAKFFAACAIWFPVSQIAAYLIGLGLAGLVLLLTYLIVGVARGKKLSRKSPLPYGVAIAAGAIFAQISNPLIGIWPV